jgi:hypothetical protein
VVFPLAFDLREGVVRHQWAAACSVLVFSVVLAPSPLAAKPASGLWATSRAACAAAIKSKAPNRLLEETAAVITKIEDANFITISGNTISSYEIICTMETAKGIALPLTCEAEGETWKQKLTARNARTIRFSGGDMSGSYTWCR